jgi:polysaccharide biosynthesis protein PslH
VTKQRLLYISMLMPERTGGGTAMRAIDHITFLAGRFDLTLAVVGDYGNAADAEARLLADIRRACASVIIISQISAINRILPRTRSTQARILIEALWPFPPEFAPFRPAMAELARRLAGQRFDVVHCFRLYAGMLRPLRRNRVTFSRAVLDLDAYESEAAFRSVAPLSAGMGRQIAAVRWLKAAKWAALESLLIPRFGDVCVCAEADRLKLQRRFSANRWHFVPNTVPEPAEHVAVEHDRFTFLFVGQLGYPPNADAVFYFCDHVLPILRRNATAKFRVLIVGRSGDVHRLTALDEIEIVFDPPEVALYYAQSDAVIVPLRAGSGTRVKIVEAFSYGLPVVSTTIGAEGLDVTPGTDILIGDDPQAFALQCCQIWSDEHLRQRIAAAGRDLWRRKYSPSAMMAALDAVYPANGAGSVGHRQTRNARSIAAAKYQDRSAIVQRREHGDAARL